MIALIFALICSPVDEEIARLKNEYNLHKSKATQEEDLAQRLQFNSELRDEARQAFRRADEERLIMKEIELRILELQTNENALQ